jgi:hypothetical protein
MGYERVRGKVTLEPIRVPATATDLKVWPMTPRLAALLSAAIIAAGTPSRSGEPDGLERGWADPPPGARVRAYWWWLNGNVTKEAITRDLEEMKAKGFGGALICDAG